MAANRVLQSQAAGGDADRGAVLQRARLALGGQRPQEAQTLAEQILKSDPRHAQALHIFGCALLMQGRAADAVTPLETAARGARDPEIETQLAIALRQAGRVEEALAQAKRATRRQPAYAPAFCELGGHLMSLRRVEEAIEVLRRGLEIAPMMPELSTQLGYAFLQRRNCAEAKAAFARALGISPASPGALFGIGKAHQEVGENAAAVDYFRAYLRARPHDAEAWLNLGHCLLELGQLDPGYECFRAAARGDAKRYGKALTSLASSARGRFWLKPSDAARRLGQKS